MKLFMISFSLFLYPDRPDGMLFQHKPRARVSLCVLLAAGTHTRV